MIMHHYSLWYVKKKESLSSNAKFLQKFSVGNLTDSGHDYG